MKKINLTLSGVVNNGFDEVSPQMATFKMFVTSVVDNHSGAKKSYPLPTLISITLREFSYLSPEDRYALAVTGSEVNVRVFGEPGHLKTEILSVAGRTRDTLENFVITQESLLRDSENK